MALSGRRLEQTCSGNHRNPRLPAPRGRQGAAGSHPARGRISPRQTPCATLEPDNTVASDSPRHRPRPWDKGGPRPYLHPSFEEGSGEQAGQAQLSQSPRHWGSPPSGEARGCLGAGSCCPALGKGKDQWGHDQLQGSVTPTSSPAGSPCSHTHCPGAGGAGLALCAPRHHGGDTEVSGHLEAPAPLALWGAAWPGPALTSPAGSRRPPYPNPRGQELEGQPPAAPSTPVAGAAWQRQACD